MEINTVVCSQYFAALAMLRQAVERCPDPLWDDPADRNRFWRTAYHALFFTHLYLQKSLHTFKPSALHREKIEDLSRETPPGSPYTKAEVLDYLEFVRQQASEKSAALDPQAKSGFHWLPFNKLELQFYNIRHLQQHTGELMERLGARAHIDVDWVSKGT